MLGYRKHRGAFRPALWSLRSGRLLATLDRRAAVVRGGIVRVGDMGVVVTENGAGGASLTALRIPPSTGPKAPR